MAFAEDILKSLYNHEDLDKIETLEDSNSIELKEYVEEFVEQVGCLGIADESETIEKINNLKRKSEETYRTIISSQQQHQEAFLDDEFVVEYADNVLENLKYCKDNLEVPIKEVSHLEKRLWFLKRFLEFITFLGIEGEKLQDVLIHILSVVHTSALISYQCFLSGGEAEVANMIKDCMTMTRFIDSEVIDSLLKSLKSSSTSEFDMMVTIANEIVIFLQDVLNHGANMNEQVKDGEIKSFHMELEFLGSFLSNEPSQYIEHVKSILSHVEVVFTEHTPKLFSIGELAYLSELSKDLKLIKVEVCILKHLNSPMEPPIKDQIEALLEGLVFMRDYFMSHKMKHISCLEFSLCKQIEEVTFKGESVTYSFDSVQRMLEDIKCLKIKASRIYLESTRLNFPRINQKAFLDSFLQYLKEDVIPTSNRIALVKQQVMAIHSSVESLRTLFCAAIERYNEHDEEFKDIKNRVVDAAFEAEYKIDSVFVREHPLWYHMLALFQVTEKIELIKSKITTEILNKNLEAKDESIQEMNTHVLPEINEEKIVGVEDEVKKIVEKLAKGKKEHHIISIVGMAKLGKTALANAVYNDGNFLNHFDVRAWCDLSGVNTKRNLLMRLLDQVGTSAQIGNSDDDGDLAQLLKKSLWGKRYLIVMDDLWDIETWEYFQMAFPKENNGSGIIFTTQLHWLVSKLSDQTTTFAHLGFFPTPISWELLKNKIFGKDRPGIFEGIGMRIAEGCYGIPYAIDSAAETLGGIEKNPEKWEEEEERIRSENITYLNDNILEPSYKHLPEHLKSCFVYWGPIINSQTIPVKKLIWLSIAEQLVQQTPNKKSLEDQAEDLLLELQTREVLVVAQQISNGRIRKCNIADHFSEFCLKKCREENIWEIINGNDDHQESYTQCRLYIHSNGRHFIMSKPSGSHVRSLIFGAEVESQNIHYDVKCITKNFRLLRVLDFGSINVGNSFPAEIVLMILLRYLAIRGNFDSIPESVSNLSDLETLIIKRLEAGSKAVGLPHTVQHMRKLRHLYIDPHVVFLPCSDYQGHKSLMLSLESNLQTISALPLVYAVDSTWTEEARIIQQWLANVRKLRFELADSFGPSSKKRNLFPFLLYLVKLESLKIFRSRGVVSSNDFSFPSNLKRLTLSKLELPWDEIFIIGRLPCLEVLKLLHNAFKGSEWNTKSYNGHFRALKFLKLDSLDIRLWVSGEGYLPSLERLALKRCEQLEIIPSCFTDNINLHTIEFWGCNDSIKNLAKEINAQREALGCEELLKVVDHPLHA